MSDTLVGKLDIVISASADRVAQECDKAGKKLDELAAKAVAKGNAMAGSQSGTVDSLQHVGEELKRTATSVDALGAKSDAVLGKQHTAWLALGAIIGGSTKDSINKVIGALDDAAKKAAGITEGFKAMSQAAWTQTDALRVSNDELANQIAILEKKPVNNVQLAMDDARVAADELAKSTSAANQQVEALLQKNHVKAFSLTNLLGQAPTARIEGTFGAYTSDLEDIGYQSQVDAHKGDTDAVAEDNRQQRSKLQSMLQKANQEIADIKSKSGGYMSHSVELQDAQAMRGVAMDQLDQMDQLQQQEQEKDQLRKDQEAQRQQQAAEEAARKAAEAARKAAALQMQGFEQGFAEMQRSHQLRIDEEKLYWERMQSQTQQGSDNWLAINKRVGELNQQLLAQQADDLKEDAKERLRVMTEARSGMAEWTKDMQQGRDISRQSALELSAQAQKNAAALQEQDLQREAGQSITRRDAAIQIAALHTANYGADTAALQLERGNIANRQGGYAHLSDTEQATKLDEIDKHIQQLEYTRAAQINSDQFAINPPDSSALVGAKDALEEFIKSTRDAAGAARSLTESTQNSVNSAIVADLTTSRRHGPRDLWTHAGHDIFTNVASTTVRAGEGMGMGWLQKSGIGSIFGGKGSKAPTGAKGDALHVIMDSGALPGGLGLGSSSLSKWLGAASPSGGDGGIDLASLISSGGAKGGPDFSRMIGDIAPFAGFFADGGSPSAGWAMLGEEGPELVKFGSSATVIPNHQLQSTFGGGGGGSSAPSIVVNAQGSLDPAQTRVQVTQGILRAAPHIAAGGVQASSERARRRPTTMR